MNKLIITSSAVIMSLSLAGCNTMDSASQYSNKTVGSAIDYSARTVGTGVGFVANTGAAIGHGVGTVAGTGVGWATGQSSSYHRGTMSHNNHHYVIKNGKYVRVN